MQFQSQNVDCIFEHLCILIHINAIPYIGVSSFFVVCQANIYTYCGCTT